MSYTIAGNIAQFKETYGMAAQALESNLVFLLGRQLGSAPQNWLVSHHEAGLCILIPRADTNGTPGESLINPYAVFAKAAALTYEAFAADTDDSDDSCSLLECLHEAAESANRLAQGWRATEQEE